MWAALEFSLDDLKGEYQLESCNDYQTSMAVVLGSHPSCAMSEFIIFTCITSSYLPNNKLSTFSAPDSSAQLIMFWWPFLNQGACLAGEGLTGTETGVSKQQVQLGPLYVCHLQQASRSSSRRSHGKRSCKRRRGYVSFEVWEVVSLVGRVPRSRRFQGDLSDSHIWESAPSTAYSFPNNMSCRSFASFLCLL